MYDIFANCPHWLFLLRFVSLRHSLPLFKTLSNQVLHSLALVRGIFPASEKQLKVETREIDEK